MKKKHFVFVRQNLSKKENNLSNESLSKSKVILLRQAELDIVAIFDRYNMSSKEANLIMENLSNVVRQKESIESLKDVTKSNKEKVSIFMNSIISSFSTEKFSHQIEDIYNKTKGKKVMGWTGILSPYIQSYDN